MTPRWGVPDALWSWLGGFAGAIVAAVIATSAGLGTQTVLFGAAVPGQYAATVLTVVAISRRKGTGSLAGDFGWRLRGSDAVWLLVGAALQYVLLFLLVPITRLAHLGNREPQDIVQQAKDTTGAGMVVLIIVATAVLAPVVEELVFRGVLLRALLRRTTNGAAIAVSAFAFAAVHVVVDPGAGYVFPGLFGLGLVLAVLAVHDRSLSRPMFVHAGFNLLATALTLATR